MSNLKLLLLYLSLVFFTACESKANTDSSMMIEMIDDPLDGMAVSKSMRKSMGAEGVIVQHKVCIPNVSDDTIESLQEIAKEDAAYEKVTKVNKCPSDATAICEAKGVSYKYYYTDAKRILDRGKEECGYVKGKWTASTQGKEVIAKTYKATFHVNGTAYTYESPNNCNINPINKDIVSTPQFGDDKVWVKLSVDTKKDTQGCMLDFSLDTKHYHTEKCKVTYDSKKLIGNAIATNIHKYDDSVEITFDIVCE